MVCKKFSKLDGYPDICSRHVELNDEEAEPVCKSASIKRWTTTPKGEFGEGCGVLVGLEGIGSGQVLGIVAFWKHSGEIPPILLALHPNTASTPTCSLLGASTWSHFLGHVKRCFPGSGLASVCGAKLIKWQRYAGVLSSSFNRILRLHES